MRWIALLLCAGLILAASASLPQAQAQNRVRVVSSFSIVGEMVQRVGGDRIDHRVLVRANSDSHTYEPTPADGAALAGAALVFQNGLGFEPWLDRLYRASGSTAVRVELAENLENLRVAGEDDDHGHTADDEHGHQGGDFDPHVWHDLAYAVQMVSVARDALMDADPSNASFYQANAAAYLGELQELDTWVFQQVEALPEDRKRLVTSHDTFGYFARRYGFEIVGTALGAATTEVADPSAGEIAELVQEIRAAGVPAIFAENVSNPRLMQQIASAAGVRLVDDLYTDALGDRGSPGETFPGLVRHNVTRIVSALSQ